MKTTIGLFTKVVENHQLYCETGWNIVEKNHWRSYDFFSSNNENDLETWPPPTYRKEKKTTRESYTKVVENHQVHNACWWNRSEKNHSPSYETFTAWKWRIPLIFGRKSFVTWWVIFFRSFTPANDMQLMILYNFQIGTYIRFRLFHIGGGSSFKVIFSFFSWFQKKNHNLVNDFFLIYSTQFCNTSDDSLQLSYLNF